jgi:hypothetical protein
MAPTITGSPSTIVDIRNDPFPCRSKYICWYRFLGASCASIVREFCLRNSASEPAEGENDD